METTSYSVEQDVLSSLGRTQHPRALEIRATASPATAHVMSKAAMHGLLSVRTFRITMQEDLPRAMRENVDLSLYGFKDTRLCFFDYTPHTTSEGVRSGLQAWRRGPKGKL